MWLVDLTYNFECHWLIELSNNKLSIINLGSISAALSSPVYVSPREETAGHVSGKACLWRRF